MNKEFDYKEIKGTFIEAMTFKFKKRMDDFSFERDHTSKELKFSMSFELYNYFYLCLNFDNGEVSFSLIGNKADRSIRLNNTQKHYENLDMEKFLAEMDNDVRSRIPDKFLVYKNWQM